MNIVKVTSVIDCNMVCLHMRYHKYTPPFRLPPPPSPPSTVVNSQTRQAFPLACCGQPAIAPPFGQEGTHLSDQNSAKADGLVGKTENAGNVLWGVGVVGGERAARMGCEEEGPGRISTTGGRCLGGRWFTSARLARRFARSCSGTTSGLCPGRRSTSYPTFSFLRWKV